MQRFFYRHYRVADKFLSKSTNQISKYYDTFFDRSSQSFYFIANEENKIKKDDNKIILSTLHTELCVIDYKKKLEEFQQDLSNDKREKDFCICPELFFPSARSSRSAPLKCKSVRTFLERTGLDEKPVLQRLFDASELSICFFDIETLLKRHSPKLNMKESKILNREEMEQESFQTYFVGLQQPVCIASFSKAPEIKKCSIIWNSLMSDFKIDTTFEDILSQKDTVTSLKLIPAGFKKIFSEKISFLMKEKFHTSDSVLEGCSVFHLEGNNCCYNDDPITTFAEPNNTNIADMTSKWMDHLFEDSKVLKLQKAIMLEPILDQIDQISNFYDVESNRGGSFTVFKRTLIKIIETNYIFGWVI